MSIDKYLNRRYNYKTYNCLHFTKDVWLDLTNIDITEKLQGLLEGMICARKISSKTMSSFTKLEKPMSPCIVLMQRPRTTPHVGIYIDGGVLHIKPKGVEFFPVNIASFGFKTVKFYK